MIEVILLLNIIFFLGAALGSFAGVLVERMYREEQFITGGSYCESCKKALKWNDMIPIISYFALKGKCRYCKKKLPKLLPIIEISMGITTMVIFYVSFLSLDGSIILTINNVINFVFLFLVFFFLQIIFFMDAKYMVIPVVPVYLIGVIYLIYAFLVYGFEGNYLYSIYGAVAMFLFFAGIHYFSNGQMMGDGDIYLAVILGFVLGLDKAILMWFLSFVLGAVYAIYLMLTKKAGLKSQVPFGPFIVLGFIISYSLGAFILNTYYLMLV